MPLGIAIQRTKAGEAALDATVGLFQDLDAALTHSRFERARVRIAVRRLRVVLSHNGSTIVPLLGRPDFNCTFSAGVSQAEGDDVALSLYARADKALYEADGLGRNRIVSFDSWINERQSDICKRKRPPLDGGGRVHMGKLIYLIPL